MAVPMTGSPKTSLPSGRAAGIRRQARGHPIQRRGNLASSPQSDLHPIDCSFRECLTRDPILYIVSERSSSKVSRSRPRG